MAQPYPFILRSVFSATLITLSVQQLAAPLLLTTVTNILRNASPELTSDWRWRMLKLSFDVLIIDPDRTNKQYGYDFRPRELDIRNSKLATFRRLPGFLMTI